ncbi:sulfite reductase [NADPH] flavoprotein alpha-component [Kurthia zopfii]|uniref:assimilatory sulfite reductase (NADPH) n=1 Tax=Kurthia zopfii TaxID=1650 RepID=A0A8B4QB71_9BACL|nr:assimilatory sulfite reductase (NADPH) flavoprotein subunit [Kurthia zopfii]PWI21690.1 assimilatory sulfite reductase (NADPH) flavoprotein subunit [Kurthia zopfii]TDR35747.1 sulfite reductase (NADPH) alpha subunit [Kurthia zopfii]GEK31212.1 sulfite reductase [NADPH] flavoprotein alpha-component [Kurthia zopfii]STX09924.1 Sulfite reductase [NADPH] flavoprotein alpha-component [Kurthia zopfii]
MSLNVKNSPFSQDQVRLINELLPKLSAEQKIWLNGFLSGTSFVAEVEQVTNEIKTIQATVLYGSQTGNAKKLAEKYFMELQQNNIQVEIASLGDFPTKKLKKTENLLIITSTQGEGEAPDQAKSFYDYLHSARAPKLENTNYAVLGLGDTSYDLFCQTAIDFDQRLFELGAKKIVERQNCDLDYEEDADQWFQSVQSALLKNSGISFESPKEAAQFTSENDYSKTKPYYAKVLEKINLNMTGSNKETYHVELSIEDSGIQFEVGDCVGILPQNNAKLVSELMQWLQAKEVDSVQFKNEEIALIDVLTNQLDLTTLSNAILEKLEVSEEKYDKEWRRGRNIVDLLRAENLKIDAQKLVDTLRKLPARLYSIASSYEANPEELHITVGLVQYELGDEDRFGVTSGMIAHSIEIGDELPIFIQKNDDFRLPADDEKIIMIGAGTGVAPYRAFIEQREETAANGESWLFFGEQHFVTDFLYQVEWQRHLREGNLSKLSLAFSRDQEEKIYVQHRIEESSEEFFNWLENGAFVYICGDEKHMAKDVEQAIKMVIANEGNLDEFAAAAYLNDLKNNKRFLRDVY